MNRDQFAILGVITINLLALARAGSEGPPSPSGEGYHERCARAVGPALGLRPQEPATGDSHLRGLIKLRDASALRRLAARVDRVEHHSAAPEGLLPILDDLAAARRELSNDPSAILPVLEARLALARLIQEFMECEAEVGRATECDVEDAHHVRLDAEVRLARARAASGSATAALPTLLPIGRRSPPPR